MTKNYGFTLAEVLITLGIIGVVAAMTMPTLMNSTQGAQYKAAYKKALSALSQAVTLNMALDEWNFKDMVANDSTYNMTNIFDKRMNWAKVEDGNTNIVLAEKDASGNPKKYYATNIAAATGVTGNNLEIAEGNTTFFFNDGIMFTFPKNAAECTDFDKNGEKGAFLKTKNPTCYGFIDVNGLKGPNRVVKCDKGTPTGTTNDVCQISSPTDVYPVKFYDQSVMPASEPARAVLYAK